MTDLERLDEALERAIPGVGDFGETEPHWPLLRVVFDAARAYRDLLASGERVEPDYEAAAKVLHERDHLGSDEPCLINDKPYMGDARRIVDAAVGGRLLVDPPKEEG